MATLGYAIGASDVDLIYRCKNQDEMAYFDFFKQYSRKVFNLAYRILGEESAAEDALQETFLNVFRGMKDFRGDAKLSTWLNRITINVCLGMLRKNRQKITLDLDHAADGYEGDVPMTREQSERYSPFAALRATEAKDQVQSVLDRLDGKHRLVVKWHDIDGFTIEEIAQRMDCPSGTVKSRLFYGRKEFKTVFNQMYRKN
ncbi:MAG: sigma-70 family RNA polymerase sigma factor [Acidobacteria bacterium]|nr:sigma-70 family RNA polymerase sigma factor [Acidobacteriota bacterium]MBI3657754.1 sigma-70 family RNA polymerase sigma factor [Acidobacteriota bacterium]